MEIRPGGELPPINAPAPRVQPQPARPQAHAGGGQAGGDSFSRAASQADEDAPFWLVQMATDRLAGRQYQAPDERRAAARAEAAWIAAMLPRCEAAAKVCLAGLADGHPRGAQGLALFNAFTAALVAAAEGPFGPVRSVWLPDKREGRGQYLFQPTGGLIQLRPVPAPPGAWLETVAHEAFHHLQQELVTALYQGEPLAAPWDLLAAYYRDARAVYKPPSAALPPAKHKLQALEVGAWSFAGGLVRRL